MKILYFPFNYPSNNKTQETALLNRDTPIVHTLPDTALLLHNRPFFVPDMSERCACSVQLAVRINRLGRSISARFASRYYDAITVAAHFTLHPLLEDLQQNGLPWDAACGFDGALALGEFKQLEEADKGKDVAYSLEKNGQIAATANAKDMLIGVNELIAAASRFYTFRQGDILLCGTPAPGVDVAIDDRIAAKLSGETLLSFNVK